MVNFQEFGHGTNGAVLTSSRGEGANNQLRLSKGLEPAVRTGHVTRPPKTAAVHPECCGEKLIRAMVMTSSNGNIALAVDILELYSRVALILPIPTSQSI